MNVVIDANVYLEYYKQCCNNQYCHVGIDSLFTIPSQRVFFDASKQIEQEWSNVCCSELTRALIIELFTEGIAVEVEIRQCRKIISKLRGMGFPSSKDKIYIQTAKAAFDIMKVDLFVLTEDIDFFDPKRKSASPAVRNKVMRSGTAPIVKFLRKNERIHVKCIESYFKLLDEVNA